jgi:DNA-binding NtrC family response regulator
MPRLLLLDRCPRTRRSMSRLLGTQHDVFATPSIFRAFRELRTHLFDIIVVRTAYRDAFALALLKWLGIRRRTVPVVVIVGPGAACDANRARDLGAIAVLPASTPAHLLCAALARAVASFALRVPQFAWQPLRPRRAHVRMGRADDRSLRARPSRFGVFPDPPA